MRAVQRRPASRWWTLAPALLTVLACVLVWLALTLPNRLEHIETSAFLRLPVEAIVYVAIVLALPPRLVRTRRVLAVVAGIVLALTAVSTILDIGFLEALNRPFDPLIDWRYAGSLVETVRGSAEGPLGIALLVLAGPADPCSARAAPALGPAGHARGVPPSGSGDRGGGRAGVPVAGAGSA